jgi:hypothetical protein
VTYTIYDGQIFDAPLLMRFNVYDPFYMGLAYGTTATFTDSAAGP